MTSTQHISTVRELAGWTPHMPLLLRRMGLGDADPETGLQTAASVAGLDPTLVQDYVDLILDEQITDPTDVMLLLVHLERTHHVYLRNVLPRLSFELAEAVDSWGLEHPHLLSMERVFAELRLDLEPHLAKEERVLFPKIRELMRATKRPTYAFGGLSAPIGAMIIEHRETDDRFLRLASLSDGYTLGLDEEPGLRRLYTELRILDADTVVHSAKENGWLFPSVLRHERGFAA
ncbi:MAG: hemerythrin domain-containing protein [Ilumatobacteraceae bacterium]